MKILLIDIETVPNLAYVWRTFKEYIGPKQLVDSSYVISFAAKWYGERDIIFDSVQQSSRRALIKHAHLLLNEADVVVHYYGSRFDIPSLNREFIKHGLTPPSPYKQVDLKEVVAKQFLFPSNKLEYVVKILGIGEKHDVGDPWKHWIACLHGDKKAWKVMKEYNIEDTLLLEGLYNKLIPWIKNHPNHGSYNKDTKEVCPNCGGTHYHRRGSQVAKLLRYPRFQCQDCGKWFRSNMAIPNRKKINRHVEI